MKQITKANFDKHGIGRQPSPVEIMTGARPTEERAWFIHEKLLGIVLFDLIDHDWSFAALHRENDCYCCFDVGVGYGTFVQAIQALEKCLKLGDR